MKTWRWMFGVVSTMALVGACTVTTGDGDEDEGEGGSSTGTGSGTTTGTGSGTGGSGTGSGTATGTSTGTASGTGTGADNCFSQPDFDACIDCLCMLDAAGCGAYDQALVDHITCGQTCGTTDCASFCNGTDDTLSQACIDCGNGIGDGNPDLDAFVAQCQASQDCVNFITQLESCPGI